MLKLFTGSDVFNNAVTVKAGSMLYEPRLPSGDVMLHWSSFSNAAADAGMSRIHGGIHFVNADTAGRSLGRQVGAEVYEKARQYWTGTA